MFEVTISGIVTVNEIVEHDPFPPAQEFNKFAYKRRLKFLKTRFLAQILFVTTEFVKRGGGFNGESLVKDGIKE